MNQISLGCNEGTHIRNEYAIWYVPIGKHQSCHCNCLIVGSKYQDECFTTVLGIYFVGNWVPLKIKDCNFLRFNQHFKIRPIGSNYFSYWINFSNWSQKEEWNYMLGFHWFTILLRNDYILYIYIFSELQKEHWYSDEVP